MKLYDKYTFYGQLVCVHAVRVECEVYVFITVAAFLIHSKYGQELTPEHMI